MMVRDGMVVDDVMVVYKEVQRGAEGCRGVQRGAEGCRGVQSGAEGCRAVQRGAEGCRAVQRGAEVQWEVSVIVCFPWCCLAQDGAEGSEYNGSWRVPCMA